MAAAPVCAATTSRASAFSTRPQHHRRSLPRIRCRTASCSRMYSVTFSATGGTAPYAWNQISGGFPGLTLSADGVLSGTPAALGDASLRVMATDSKGDSHAKMFTIHIDLPPPTPTRTPRPTPTCRHLRLHRRKRCRATLTPTLGRTGDRRHPRLRDANDAGRRRTLTCDATVATTLHRAPAASAMDAMARSPSTGSSRASTSRSGRCRGGCRRRGQR